MKEAFVCGRGKQIPPKGQPHCQPAASAPSPPPCSWGNTALNTANGSFSPVPQFRSELHGKIKTSGWSTTGWNDNGLEARFSIGMTRTNKSHKTILYSWAKNVSIACFHALHWYVYWITSMPQPINTAGYEWVLLWRHGQTHMPTEKHQLVCCTL